jgi:cytochrome c oxidase subunit 2
MKKIIITTALLFTFTAVTAADLGHGKELYERCTACHGDKGQGNDALNAPAIAGQKTWYVERQLKNFIDGVRGKNPKDIYGLMMRPMAVGLTGSNDVVDVAAYISTLK